MMFEGPVDRCKPSRVGCWVGDELLVAWECKVDVGRECWRCALSVVIRFVSRDETWTTRRSLS